MSNNLQLNSTHEKINITDSILMYGYVLVFICCGIASRFAFGIKTRKYKKIKSKDTIYDECPICLEYFDDKDKLAKLKCDHVFHVDCIKKWIPRESSCPTCRIIV